MNYFVIFFLHLIIFSTTISKDFVLVCKEINQVDQSDFIGMGPFKKKIDFENKTLSNISGKQFDKILLFGRNEVIIENKIFNTVSTYNIKRQLWTTYSRQSVFNFKCTIE